MAHIPRHNEILNIISRLRSVSVFELTKRLSVSEVTIRKDLTMLEEMGYVIRTHGGARLAEDRSSITNLQTRKRERPAEKRLIADKARNLINEGDTIYIDSGSTCYYLASQITEMTLRVLTNSLEVLSVLADAPGISLVSVGGSFRKDARSFIGPMAEENVRRFQIETCFVGATGISKNLSFSAQNEIEAQFKRQVLGVSKRKVILADRSKVEVNAFSVFATSLDIDVLIIDSDFLYSSPEERRDFEIITAEG